MSQPALLGMAAMDENQFTFRDAMLHATARQADYAAFMSEDV
ncbi:MAG: hypothetical protein OXK20_02920 [Deltaproteobacteria bacterium]|nr:hypothetical protein [Deltaproteobacteria bacterium]